MNLALLGGWLLLSSCVLDRTGQSATEAYRRNIALQGTRIEALDSSLEDALRRIEQVEEVTKARGQEEIYRMETLDQLRNEVARLRGDLEVVQHDMGLDIEFSGKFREDVDYRLTYLERRAAALEEALGLQPPPPPEQEDLVAVASEGQEEASADQAGGQSTEDAAADVPSTDLPSTPDDLLALGREHLDGGRYKAARAVFQRFIESWPDDDKVPEAQYYVGQSLYLEGQYQQAVLAYQEVLDRFPTSEWAPWSMLRQGQCFSAMGQGQNATLFYDDVVRLYPKSKAAKEARKLRSQ